MRNILKSVWVTFFVFVAFTTNAAFARDLDKLYKKAKFKIGKETIEAYIADTESGRAQGLMFIEKLPASTGMLFAFETEEPQGFWMKNTLIPLAIGFFDKSGVLIDIQEMKTASSLVSADIPSYQSRGPAQFALEMNTGWFSKHGIKTGAKIERVGKTPSALVERLIPAARH